MVSLQRRLDQSVQQTLRRVFLAMGGVVLLAFLVSLGFGRYLVARLDTVYADRVVPLHDLQRISDMVNARIPRALAAAVERGASPDTALAPHWAEIEALWAAYQLTYMTPAETVLARQVRTALDQLRRQLFRRATALAGPPQAAHEGAVLQFNTEMAALLKLQVDVARDNLEQARSASQWAVVAALLMVAAVLLLALLAHRLIADSIIAPIRWVASALEHLATGEARPQPQARTLNADFSEVLDQIALLQAFLAERQRLLQEEQRISQRLRSAQSELVEAEKLASLGGLVAGVAHELNTPIGVAVTVASSLEEKRRVFAAALAGGALKRSALDVFLADVLEATRLLLQNLERASGLVSSFKQVAVDRTGMTRRRFDLRQVVDEIMASLRPSLRGNPLQLVNEIPPGIELDSYPGALGQVLGNLLSNAVIHAFGDAASPLSVVRVGARRLDGDRVALTVADNGAGIAPEHLARVFEPFFTTRLGQGGSGLGLSIVRNIVVGALGGRLDLQSALGQGSTIDIELPVVAPLAAATSQEDTAIYAVH
ncbi:ATP-binding protein [Hydrogenophaga sp. OTU3427]|uniref:ATP-binding protein n=1 Tax=Hydrogenophaga sp. OTU3427 TaxID=3043856 RepID=UPI00313E12E9